MSATAERSATDVVGAQAEAMRLCQGIAAYQSNASASAEPKSGGDTIEALAIALLDIHDDVIVPPLLAAAVPAQTNSGSESDGSAPTVADATAASTLAGMRAICQAFTTASAYLPLEPAHSPSLRGGVCVWQRILNTIALGAAHPALPSLVRAFLIKSTPEVVAWRGPADAASAASTRERGDAVGAALVRLLHALHEESARSASTVATGAQQLTRIACTSVLQLPPSALSTVAQALVTDLPASLEASVLLLNTPTAPTTRDALGEAFERALYPAAPSAALAVSQPGAADVAAAQTTLTNTLRTQYPAFGRLAAQQRCNQLLTSPIEDIFSSLRAVEHHVNSVVSPLLEACVTARATARQAEPQRRREQHALHGSASSAATSSSASSNTTKTIDHLVAENVSLTFLCTRFSGLWGWYMRESTREGSTQKEACAAAALSLGRAYAGLAAFTVHLPRDARLTAHAASPTQAEDPDEKEGQASTANSSRLSALIPSEAELEVILSPVLPIMEQAEARDHERLVRRQRAKKAMQSGRAALPESHPASPSSPSAGFSSSDTSSSSSSSTVSSEDDEQEGREEGQPLPDRTLTAVLDAPLPLLECYLLLLTRLVPFIGLTEEEEATAAAETPSRPPRRHYNHAVPSSRMRRLAQAAHALRYHTVPAIKDILSLADVHAQHTSAETSDKAAMAAAVEADQSALTTAPSDVPSARPVLASLCRLTNVLWQCTGSGRRGRRWRVRGSFGGWWAPSWQSRTADELHGREDEGRRGRGGGGRGRGGGDTHGRRRDRSLHREGGRHHHQESRKRRRR